MTNRIRMWVILSVLSVAACTSQSGRAPELPKSISPEWKLQSFVKTGDDWQGSYAGPGIAHVRVHAIEGGAVGLDLVQKWKPRANTVVFYSERYFTVVDWESVSAAQARALVGALESALK